MARRRRRRDRDDATSVSSSPLRSPVVQRILEPSFARARTFLQQLEDRREFDPNIARPARAFVRSAARLEVGNANVPRKSSRVPRIRFAEVPHNVRFGDPRRVAICVRRHQRREVLHALRHVGRGSKVKRPRYNEFSDVHCR